MKKFILWALCSTILTPTKAQIKHSKEREAQQSYEKAYIKTRALTNTSPDSAMLWAEKCLGLAKTNGQYYGAYYLRGFNAYKLCMYQQAMYDYHKARAYTIPNSKNYFKVNNSLGDVYLKTGKYAKAVEFNQLSINYNKRNKIWVNLSYAYNVKANILHQQNDKAALSVFYEALELRKKHAPKDAGYVYEDMAKAFATFGMPDSAVAYQRLALQDYPIKSASKTATLHTQLAKYLLLSNQTAQAFAHLQQVAYLKKPPMTQLFWMHTLSMYYASIEAQTKALQAFARCDDLLGDILDKATDIVTWRTVNKYANEMYNNALALPYLSKTERKLYDNRIKFIKTSLGYLEAEAKHKDDDYQKKIKEKIKKNQQLKTDSAKLKLLVPRQGTANSRVQHTPDSHYLFMVFSLLAALGGMRAGAWWFLRKLRSGKPAAPPKNTIEAPVAKPAPVSPKIRKNMMDENGLIKTLEEKMDKKLKKTTRTMVFLYYSGLSFAEVAQATNITSEAVRARFKNVAKQAGVGNFKTFADAYIDNEKEDLDNNEKNN